MMKLSLIIFFAIISLASATHKCVWVRGILRCNKDPSKNFNVEVRVYDRDGFSIFQMIDPDDLMGVSFTEQDGSFQLDGCGDDFNWFPGVENPPEPYVQIRHFCNSEAGETLELPAFETFVPETHDIGILELDSESQNLDIPSRKNKNSKEVHVAEPSGNEFVEQARNPKFHTEVVRTLDHSEEDDTEINSTKRKVAIVHPDDKLSSLESD